MRRHKYRCSGGFTLIELVLVLGMLVIVLGVTYNMLIDYVETERTVDKLTQPEKVAEGILSLFREDLAGTVYRGLGTRVFFVADNGAPPDAHDEIRFITTREPTPREDSFFDNGVQELRTLTGVAYYLRPNRLDDGTNAFTLFRKEIVDFDDVNPLESLGINYEVFDKVAYLSFQCFDGLGWYLDWDSEARIQEEQMVLEEGARSEVQGIARVGDPQDASANASSATRSPSASATPSATGATGPSRSGTSSRSVEDANVAAAPEVLPPAGVPVAVRIDIGIYVATGNKVERRPNGEPMMKEYSTVVPILVAERLSLDFEDELDLLSGGGLGGVAGDGEGMSNLPAGLKAASGLTLPGVPPGMQGKGQAGAMGRGQARGGARGGGSGGTLKGAVRPPPAKGSKG